jgi:hypothetical protein
MNVKRLAHKVIAQNAAAKLANEMVPNILTAGWRVFGHTRVFNQGDTLTKKFRDHFKMENNVSCITYFHTSRYSIWLKIRCNSHDSQGINESAEISILLFGVEGGILSNAYDYIPCKEDWTQEEVEKGNQKIRSLEDQLNDAKLELPEIFR